MEAVTHAGYIHNDLTRMDISEFPCAESFKLDCGKAAGLT